MDPDLQRYLDGEIPREELPPELAVEAAEWDTLLDAAAPLRDEHAPRWLEGRVMSRLPERRGEPAWRRVWSWFVRPHTISLRPAAVALAGAAAVLLVAVWPQAPERSPLRIGPNARGASVAAADSAARPVYVQFVFAADDAESVAIAGDFNQWQPGRNVLRDPDGDGVWTGRFALPAGLHKYMFVVNGERWVTDPRAERYVEDGFGMRNALIAVRAPSGSTAS